MLHDRAWAAYAIAWLRTFAYPLRGWFLVMTLIGTLLWMSLVRWWDAARPESWAASLAMVLLGAAASHLVFSIGDMVGQFRTFGLNGRPVNDALYAMLGIGLVEETVKLLPLLVLLPLRRLIDERVDWAVYGCLSALGFSLLENYQYLVRTGVQAGIGRVFSSTPFHMSLTGGVVLWIVFSKRHGVGRALDGAMALAVAAILHGAYDFVLLHHVYMSGLMAMVLVITLLGFLAESMQRAELMGLPSGATFLSPHSQAHWIVVAFVALAAISYFINIRDVGHGRAVAALGGDALYLLLVVRLLSSVLSVATAPAPPSRRRRGDRSHSAARA